MSLDVEFFGFLPMQGGIKTIITNYNDGITKILTTYITPNMGRSADEEGRLR